MAVQQPTDGTNTPPEGANSDTPSGQLTQLPDGNSQNIVQTTSQADGGYDYTPTDSGAKQQDSSAALSGTGGSKTIEDNFEFQLERANAGPTVSTSTNATILPSDPSGTGIGNDRSAPPGAGINPGATPTAPAALANVNNKYRVRLVSTLPGSLARTVEFKVTPEFTENRTVEYTSIVPLHMPGSIEVYKNTNSRTFTIGAKLISRTFAEATLNMFDLQILRSWTMPFFGINSSTTDNNAVSQRLQSNDANAFESGFPEAGKSEKLSIEAKNQRAIAQARGRRNSFGRQVFANQAIEMLGAPPEVLYLYAYSATDNSQTSDRGAFPVNINRVPVVMTNLGITYPTDVEYIQAASGEPFPIIMNITIELKETHSPTEYMKFSLLDYKLGTLKNF